MAYLFNVEKILGNYLWIPARVVIIFAIIITGTKLGIIKNQKDKIFDLNEKIKNSIILKIVIFPSLIFIICRILNFNLNQTSAVVLQASTPTAISTILMAEAYKINQKIAAKILFTSTLISIITIPFLTVIIKFP